MNRLMSVGLALGFGLAVSACESAEESMMMEPDATPMNASEITKYVADKTAYGEGENNSRYAIFYDPSGELRGKSSGSWGTSTDTGTWEVTDNNMLCLQFKTWRNGAKRCWQLYEEDGAVTWVGKVGPADTSPEDNTWRDGNTENL